MNRGVIFLILLAFISAKCGEDSPNPALEGDSFDFNLKEGESKDFEFNGQPLYFTMVSIEDQRCPLDANCIRFGEAKVKLGTNGIREILTMLDFCIGDCLDRDDGFLNVDTLEADIDDISYGIVLKDVQPYPSSVNEDVVKEAFFTVYRK